MNHSEQINEISTALSKAQAEISGSTKDAKNPHFKNQYSTLSAVWEACRGPLTANGIAVVQIPSADGQVVTVETILTHTSGQFIKGSLTMAAGKNTPQAIGSAITYARRYALASFVSVAPEDDDANAATHPTHNAPDAPPRATPAQLKMMFSKLSQSSLGPDDLKKFLKTNFAKENSRELTPIEINRVFKHLDENPKTTEKEE